MKINDVKTLAYFNGGNVSNDFVVEIYTYIYENCKYVYHAYYVLGYNKLGFHHNLTYFLRGSIYED